MNFEAFVVVLPRTERLVDTPLEADLVALAIDTDAELRVEEPVTAFGVTDLDLEVAAVEEGSDDGELGLNPRFEGFICVREHRSLLALLEVGSSDDTYCSISLEEGVNPFESVRQTTQTQVAGEPVVADDLVEEWPVERLHERPVGPELAFVHRLPRDVLKTHSNSSVRDDCRSSPDKSK